MFWEDKFGVQRIYTSILIASQLSEFFYRGFAFGMVAMIVCQFSDFILIDFMLKLQLFHPDFQLRDSLRRPTTIIGFLGFEIDNTI